MRSHPWIRHPEARLLRACVPFVQSAAHTPPLSEGLNQYLSPATKELLGLDLYFQCLPAQRPLKAERPEERNQHQNTEATAECLRTDSIKATCIAKLVVLNMLLLRPKPATSESSQLRSTDHSLPGQPSKRDTVIRHMAGRSFCLAGGQM